LQILPNFKAVSRKFSNYD